MSELHRIAGCNDKTRVADIIFVHGLNPVSRDSKGFAFGTWNGNDANSDFWPKWLYEDLRDDEDGPVNVGVWLLEYDSSASGWFGPTMPLSDRATNIFDLLYGENLGKRPIIFITHSMGGLVVKEILRRGITEKKTEWLPIAEKIRGVVFLSTPHTGADFASFLQLLKVALRLSESMADLKENNVQLRTLAEWYRDNAPELGIATRSYGEKHKQLGVLVVDETSANPQIARASLTMLDADHSGVAKPASRTAQQCRSVLRFVKECLANVPPATTTPPQPSSSSVTNAPADERLLKFLDGLTPSDFERVLIRIPNAHNQMPHSGTHTERAVALVRFAGSANGPGIAHLTAVVTQLFPTFRQAQP